MLLLLYADGCHCLLPVVCCVKVLYVGDYRVLLLLFVVKYVACCCALHACRLLLVAC